MRKRFLNKSKSIKLSLNTTSDKKITLIQVKLTNKSAINSQKQRNTVKKVI